MSSSSSSSSSESPPRKRTDDVSRSRSREREREPVRSRRESSRSRNRRSRSRSRDRRPRRSYRSRSRSRDYDRRNKDRDYDRRERYSPEKKPVVKGRGAVAVGRLRADDDLETRRFTKSFYPSEPTKVPSWGHDKFDPDAKPSRSRSRSPRRDVPPRRYFDKPSSGERERGREEDNTKDWSIRAGGVYIKRT